MTRQAVIDAARELVVSEGADAISLRGLARRLGVTAPALYAYVDDREDLLRAVAGEGLGQLGARFDAIDTDDPVDRLRQQCRCYVEFAVENPDLFLTMFTFPPQLSVAAPLGIEIDEATTLFGRAVEAIDEAVRQGAIAQQDDTLVASLAMWATMHGTATVLTMGFGFDDGTKGRIIDRTIDGALAALGATSGADGRDGS